MKLTGELKDKVDAGETAEEKKDIIAQAGMELTDDELEMVAGGSPIIFGDIYHRSTCNKCGNFAFLSRGKNYDLVGGVYISHVCSSDK